MVACWKKVQVLSNGLLRIIFRNILFQSSSVTYSHQGHVLHAFDSLHSVARSLVNIFCTRILRLCIQSNLLNVSRNRGLPKCIHLYNSKAMHLGKIKYVKMLHCCSLECFKCTRRKNLVSWCLPG